jgi:probable F420-dependent oxidoreductase
MRLSTILLPRGAQGTRETLIAIGQAAEQAGLSKVWFGDHIVYPVEIKSIYPGTGGALGFNPATPQLDLIVAMTVVALATERVGVGTSVVVLAQRNPVAFAKQLASLDVISGGRLSLGVGVGWCAEEFEALGVPFERRGARTDEYLQAMRVLWTEPEPAFDGEFVKFAPVYCNPKPVQPGGPQIWIGGYGEAALDRVARHGAGFLAGARLSDPEEVVRLKRLLRQRAADLGRPDADQIGLQTTFWIPDRDAYARRLREMRDAGLDEACVPVQGKSPAEVRDFILSIPDLVG